MTVITRTEVSALLKSMLAQSIKPRAAAKQLTDQVESRLKPSPSQEDDESPSPIYEEILQQSRTITHDNPIQEQLIALLSEIKSTSSAKRGPQYWQSLEPLGLTVREAWNGELEENTIQGWTSLNAFVARLTSRELQDFDTYAIWSLRTLEDFSLVPKADPSEELTADVLDSHVPAAAVWVLYDGERISSLAKKAEVGDRSTRGGPRWSGPPGYSVERWQLWKERLGSLAVRADLKPETRDISHTAHAKMVDIDRTA